MADVWEQPLRESWEIQQDYIELHLRFEPRLRLNVEDSADSMADVLEQPSFSNHPEDFLPTGTTDLLDIPQDYIEPRLVLNVEDAASSSSHKADDDDEQQRYLSLKCNLCSPNVGIHQSLLLTICGHVFCENCVNSFVDTSKQCTVCKAHVCESRVFPFTAAAENLLNAIYVLKVSVHLKRACYRVWSSVL